MEAIKYSESWMQSWIKAQTFMSPKWEHLV